MRAYLFFVRETEQMHARDIGPRLDHASDGGDFRLGAKTDRVPASRLLEAALRLPQRVKLVCYEDNFESLLGESDIALFGIPALAQNYRAKFPSSLNGAPLLLLTRNHAIRGRINPRIVMRRTRQNIRRCFNQRKASSSDDRGRPAFLRWILHIPYRLFVEKHR